MLSLFITPLLILSSVSAAPTENSILSIPVHDIVKDDLSAYQAYPNIEIYTRWLQTPPGAFIQRDPKAAFAKHSNLVSIDCYSNTATCFLTSQIANSPKELSSLDEQSTIYKKTVMVRTMFSPRSTSKHTINLDRTTELPGINTILLETQSYVS